MSYFGEELARQLDAKTVSGQALADRTGMSPSQISKWVRGEQTSINSAQLSAIQAALTDDINIHAALVAAHLQDEKFGLGEELVDVVLKTDAGVMRDRPRIQSKGERALVLLAQERPRNRDLNELLIDLVRLLGLDQKPRVSSAQKSHTQDTSDPILDILKEGDSPSGDPA